MKKTTLPICQLGDLAKVGLGFKSLQNHFYYLSDADVEKYAIEDDFLRPIYQMKQLKDSTFLQTQEPSLRVFFCREEEEDLYGKGALKYIRAMQNRPATEKKQGGKKQTIRQALEAQSGGLWYAPKALLNKSHLWLRKARE